jgi:hypothetical protein
MLPRRELCPSLFFFFRFVLQDNLSIKLTVTGLEASNIQALVAREASTGWRTI